MTARSPIDEKELLEKLRNGDEMAFEMLYNQYSKRIYWKLRRMVKIEEEVEELFQELFIKIWERRTQIDPQQSFSYYLYRIAENIVYDFYRKLSRNQQLQNKIISSTCESYDHIEESIFKKETASLLDQAIATLPPQRRQAFTLCKLEEKSYAEAAEIMGISPNTVHNHIVKATQSLKEYLSGYQNHSSTLLLLLAFSAVH